MFVPPNDWPEKYIVTESRAVPPDSHLVTYTTKKGPVSSFILTFHRREIAPGVFKDICNSDKVFEDGDVCAYQVSLSCFEIYHKSTGRVERHCIGDGWQHLIAGVYCVRDKVAVHLISPVGDDLLHIDSEVYQLSNLNADASVSVRGDKLIVGVDSSESVDMDDLPEYVSVYVRNVYSSLCDSFEYPGLPGMVLEDGSWGRDFDTATQHESVHRGWSNAGIVITLFTEIRKVVDDLCSKYGVTPLDGDDPIEHAKRFLKIIVRSNVGTPYEGDEHANGLISLRHPGGVICDEFYTFALLHGAEKVKWSLDGFELTVPQHELARPLIEAMSTLKPCPRFQVK